MTNDIKDMSKIIDSQASLKQLWYMISFSLFSFSFFFNGEGEVIMEPETSLSEECLYVNVHYKECPKGYQFQKKKCQINSDFLGYYLVN